MQTRCLFATHYHELTKLQESHPGIVNYHLACKKTAQGIIFLHHVQPGVATGSFGLEVAKLADLPFEIVERARKILQGLSEEGISRVASIQTHFTDVTSQELLEKIAYLETTVRQQNALLADLTTLNLDDLSPRQAYELLWNIKMKQKA